MKDFAKGLSILMHFVSVSLLIGGAISGLDFIHLATYTEILAIYIKLTA